MRWMIIRGVKIERMFRILWTVMKVFLNVRFTHMF